MTQTEINVTTACITALASQPNADEKIKILLTSLFNSYKREGFVTKQENKKTYSGSAPLLFTIKEISKMDSKFKKIFIANGLVAKVYIRKCGYYQTTYEIRYRSHGYNFSCTAKTLDKLKAEFLRKTQPGELEKYKAKPSQRNKKRKDTLHVYFEEWLSLKRGNIGEKEIKRFQTNFNNLPEELRYKPIYEIRAIDLDAILKDVQPRKYEELRTLFNGIFKYAVASGIIQNNPVALIKFKRAERQNRESLSQTEITSFLREIKDSKYDEIRQGAYILYYFGLRPCEIDEETHIEGDFLIARNRKRKNGKIEYKKIPIPKDAWKMIDWNKPITFQCRKERFHHLFKELLKGKTAYSLRHTFATICQQYVRPDIVDIWMGDSPQRLVGKVYTHFPDEFMLENMLKVEFPKE